ncbi:type II toxin-antitoxin system VapC family toxin [soil metagenome]
MLIDSDVLIAHLRGVDRARDFLLAQRRRGPLYASAVSLAEVTGGMRSAERAAVWRLLASLIITPVTERIALRAGEFARTFRRSHRAIGIVDYLIAGTAAELGLSLATLNVRHYPMFDDLEAAF